MSSPRPARSHSLEIGPDRIVLRLPDPRLLRLISRSVLLTAAIVSFPWLRAAILAAAPVPPPAAPGSRWIDDPFILPMLLRDLRHKGLLKPGDRAIFLGDAMPRLRLLRKYSIDPVGWKPVILDRSVDFVLAADGFGDPNFSFIDRVLRIGGVTAVRLGSDPSQAFNMPSNYRLAYIRRFGSTVVAIKKIAHADVRPNSHSHIMSSLADQPAVSRMGRRLQSVTAPRAVLEGLEGVLMEPPREGTPAPQTMYLPELMGEDWLLHVFGYATGRRTASVPVLDPELNAVMRVSPGLSSYTGHTDSAGESLMELLEFAKGKVPRDQWGDTDVRLLATAGMRLVDAGARDEILESCRRVLKSSGFRFMDDWATVIPGADEGIYAWVTANYALGTLGGDPKRTIGIIELGGASAQVAFVISEPMAPEFLQSHVLKFGETTYNLYSNSFLHFGQNVAYESLHQLLGLGDLNSPAESIEKRVIIDPCTPKGFSPGVKSSELSLGMNDLKQEYQPVADAIGNFSKCRSAALKLLSKEKDKCLYQDCHLGTTFIPKLQGRFLATENFFYTLKFFGLDPKPVLSDLVLAGKQFCGEDWSNIKKKYYTLDEEILSRYCFSSAYIVALLHDSLGIALDDKRIEFANEVGDVPLEWALGAFIMHMPSGHRTDWITTLFNSRRTLLPVFSMIIFSAWSVWRLRKSQLKTIYDLEKGRYIVTRISV